MILGQIGHLFEPVQMKIFLGSILGLEKAFLRQIDIRVHFGPKDG
jgi:hypothetical protein